MKKKCRFCGCGLDFVFVDLYSSAPSNSFLTLEKIDTQEILYPLRVMVCRKCLLVQIDEYKSCREIFDEDYAYFSSVSSTWVQHAKEYVEMIIPKLKLTINSLVVEVASNDGYLLQFFKQRNIPCLGIEPTHSTAKSSRERGINVIEDFFSYKLTEELKKCDLLIGNNVIAHVPEINDFVRGVKNILKSEGVATFEFPHILKLIRGLQYDTIYHEHFSYYTIEVLIKIFKRHKLKIFDVESLETHGGSLRVYVTHDENDKRDISENVNLVLQEERSANLDSIVGYMGFQTRVVEHKHKFLKFLLNCKSEGKKVCGYGAAAKGSTILNYCGVHSDLLPFIVDASHSKEGKFMPQSHIPIVHEKQIVDYKPDFIIIFPWNIQNEIVSQLEYTKEWGCKLLVLIPEIKYI